MGEMFNQSMVEQGDCRAEGRAGLTVLITSGKGGAGATTIAVNLGAIFALLGKRVVVVEASVGNRHADAMMGLQNRIVHDLVDVTGGLASVQQALVKDRRIDRLYLLAGAQTRTTSEVDPTAFHALLQELKREFDLVLIDAPAQFARTHEPTLRAVDRVVLVTSPESCSLRASSTSLYYLSKLRDDAMLLINRYDAALARRGVLTSLEEIAQILPQPLLGVVLKDDEAFLTGMSRGELVAYDVHSPVAVALEHVARRLLGESVPLDVPECTRVTASRGEVKSEGAATSTPQPDGPAVSDGQVEQVRILLAELGRAVDSAMGGLSERLETSERAVADLLERLEASERASADLQERLRSVPHLESRLERAESTLAGVREALFQLDTRRAVELLAAYGLADPAAPRTSPAA